MNKVNLFFNLSILFLNAPLVKLHFYFFQVFEQPFVLELYIHIWSLYKKLLSDGVNPYKAGR